jgi:hypothetical protein
MEILPTAPMDQLGLASVIVQLRVACDAYGRKISEGKGSPRDVVCWTQLIDSLRKAESDWPDIQKKNNLVIATAEVEQKWIELSIAYCGRLKKMPMRLAKQLEGLDAMSIQIKLWAEIDSIMAMFYDEHFQPPSVPTLEE